MKNYNMILRKKLEKYQPYHQVKFINIYFLKETYNDELALEYAFEKQVKFKNKIDTFKEFTKEQKKEKLLTAQNAERLFKGK